MTGTALAVALMAAAAPVAAAGPVASVNHFFAVVDAQTAEAISRSPLLREAANLDIHATSTPGGRHWTGRYVRGRQTYVEFFGPGDLDDGATPIGSIGVGFGGDAQGSVQAIAARLQARGHALPVTMVRRQLDGRAVDWFWAVEMPELARQPGLPTASAWAMEYVPSYFDRPGAHNEPPEGAAGLVSRERALDDLYRAHLVRDLEEAELSITAEQYRLTFAPLLAAAGFSIAPRPDGATASSMELRLSLHFVAPAEIGLNRIVLRLNRPAPARAEAIGHSCLVVGPGRTAVWRFGRDAAPCETRTGGAMAPSPRAR
jgi:hypothetical protein